MADTHSEAYYHFIWSTKSREATITAEKEPKLHAFLRHKCGELDTHVYAVNGMENHIHLVVSIPLTMSIADSMKHVKGSSSYFLNHLPEDEGFPLLAAGIWSSDVCKARAPGNRGVRRSAEGTPSNRQALQEDGAVQ